MRNHLWFLGAPNRFFLKCGAKEKRFDIGALCRF
jgi:hypothetical protein